MRYHVLAADYDGTLATDGHVDNQTLDALHRLRESGRRLVLVTGRIIAQLRDVFPPLEICDLVVADNGAVIYDPRANEFAALADRPSDAFIQELARRGVSPIEVGNVIVATWEPHESTVLKTIQDLGLELQIIFNKGAVMVLPTGVNKATGLRAALSKLGFSHHNTVGIGDAENDETFLRCCGASAAVQNALQVVKDQVNFVTQNSRGAGVTELIDRLIADERSALPSRHDPGMLVGAFVDGEEMRIPVYSTRVLLTGSRNETTKFAIGLIEQLNTQEFQYCIITPDGRYGRASEAVTLGTSHQPAGANEVLQVIADPHKNCIVNMPAPSEGGHTDAFCDLMSVLSDNCVRTGHPHWCFVDDACELMPAVCKSGHKMSLNALDSLVLVTEFPERLPVWVVDDLDVIVAIGGQAEKYLTDLSELVNEAPPKVVPSPAGAKHQALAWWRKRQLPPRWFNLLRA
jgi:HAD superfamily hydrolase (TIGR01484 family)